jgi:hypothetical protein
VRPHGHLGGHGMKCDQDDDPEERWCSGCGMRLLRYELDRCADCFPERTVPDREFGP